MREINKEIPFTFTKGEIMSSEAEQRIRELEAQLAQEKAKHRSSGLDYTDMPIKFGQKQNISIYKLGQRFPATLYAPGWVKLIMNINKLKDFIRDNHADLAWGDEGDPFEGDAAPF